MLTSNHARQKAIQSPKFGRMCETLRLWVSRANALRRRMARDYRKRGSAGASPYHASARLCTALFLLLFRLSTFPADVLGKHGAVATVHPLATEAATNAFHKGGNAIDATVAAALTLGVVDGQNSGIGGGCFLLIRAPDGKVIAIDGREMAPAAATRDMFLRDGKADTQLSLTGALASGVPGSLAAYDYALKNFGRLKLADLLLPAAEIAERGFPISKSYAHRLAEVANELALFPAAKSIFLHSDGTPLEAGETLRQPDLAASYRAIAEHGIDWFYKTGFPERVEQWMKENDGLITAEDFRHYEIKLREPIHSFYRGYEIYGFPPPSSGGLHVAEILNILSGFDLQRYPTYSANSIHLIAEAMKLAFADRAFWLGDPDFADVPRGLISTEYAAALAKQINPDHSRSVTSHGDPEKSDARLFGKHTTHFSAADDRGYWVACTATINTTFGSKVVIPGTGIVLNNQMDDFSIQPGVPNFFGLIGAEANAVGPRKRPLSSMSPTIVLKDGKPVLALGAAGGPTIISQTVINLVNIIDYGMELNEALARPRFHHQWRPDELRVESTFSKYTQERLEKMGHKVVTGTGGAAQVVQWTKDGFIGASDPRLEGKAAGY
jgi:gamma-glutamyltranspeptidase/glutathione hydrolase